MRTEYRLWTRDQHHGGYTKRSLHPTMEAAQAAAGLPPGTGWRTFDNGNTCPESIDGVFIAEERVPESDADRIALAIDTALEYGQFDGDHHKAWCIDQIVRVLTGDQYDTVIAEYRDGIDGPDTYEWDEGIAP